MGNKDTESEEWEGQPRSTAAGLAVHCSLWPFSTPSGHLFKMPITSKASHFAFLLSKAKAEEMCSRITLPPTLGMMPGERIPQNQVRFSLIRHRAWHLVRALFSCDNQNKIKEVLASSKNAESWKEYHTHCNNKKSHINYKHHDSSQRYQRAEVTG